MAAGHRINTSQALGPDRMALRLRRCIRRHARAKGLRETLRAVCRVPCALCRVPCALCRVPCALCRMTAGAQQRPRPPHSALPLTLLRGSGRERRANRAAP